MSFEFNSFNKEYELCQVLKNNLKKYHIFVNEYIIRRRLYYYSFMDKYQKLLSNKNNDVNDFTKVIEWNVKDPESYDLCFMNDIDIRRLSMEAKELIKPLFNDLLMRFKLEKESNMPLCLYNANPNGKYKLVGGYYNNILMEWLLLHDGNITRKLFSELNDEFYKSPFSPGEYLKLDDNLGEIVDLVDSSFAILQAKTGNNINYVNIFTEENDINNLKEIIDLSSKQYNQEDLVRKISLK